MTHALSNTSRALNTTLLATLIASITLASTAPAFADGKRFYHSGGYGYGGYGFKGKPGTFGKGARFGYHFGYQDGFRYRNSYSYGYRDYGYRDYGFRHKRGNSGDVALGIGLGVLGLAVLGAASQSRADSSVRAERVVRQDRDVVFVPQNEDRWSSPAPSAASDALDFSKCQVVREYTTTVEIGGKRVEAFGDACLQADGSWRMGPVKGTAQ